MIRVLKCLGLMMASVLSVFVMFFTIEKYLEKFRKNYITIENEYINV